MDVEFLKSPEDTGEKKECVVELRVTNADDIQVLQALHNKGLSHNSGFRGGFIRKITVSIACVR